MCRKLQVHGSNQPISFYFTFFFFPSEQNVTTWVQTSQVSSFSLFLFSFLCMLKLLHVHCIWVDSTFSLFGPAFLLEGSPCGSE